jgi:hypothetical protein
MKESDNVLREYDVSHHCDMSSYISNFPGCSRDFLHGPPMPTPNRSLAAAAVRPWLSL